MISSSQNAHVTVREARREDIQGILSVQLQAGRSASESLVSATLGSIDDASRLVVVAEVSGVMAGWATTWYWADDDGAAPSGHYLMGVTVAPEQRRLGIGHDLIDRRIEWVRNRADRVMFFVNAKNEASLAAHRRWPFQEIARGDEFRGVRFDGGLGLLFRAGLG